VLDGDGFRGVQPTKIDVLLEGLKGDGLVVLSVADCG